MELLEYLKASTPAEEQIKNYLVTTASDALKEKILKSNKNLSDCMNYLASQVKEKAKNGCYCGSDDEIFGMVIHYFEEDEIEPVTTSSARVETTAKPITPKPKKEKKVEVKEETPKQMTLFDLEGF